MENPEQSLKIPNQLCQNIFNCQFEIDIGNITQQIISKTIELYSQAMSYFINQKIQTPQVKKRTQFYQQKIKKLLTRKDVEKCLIGKKINPKCIDIQHQIQKIKESAPQQAKALIQFYKAQYANQQRIIKKLVEQQNSKLSQRIAQRSRSKSNYGQSPAKKIENHKLYPLRINGLSLKQF